MSAVFMHASIARFLMVASWHVHGQPPLLKRALQAGLAHKGKVKDLKVHVFKIRLPTSALIMNVGELVDLK